MRHCSSINILFYSLVCINRLQVSIRSHMTQVDNLISIHETRTTLLENEFETDLQSLRVEFESEMYDGFFVYKQYLVLGLSYICIPLYILCILCF